MTFSQRVLLRSACFIDGQWVAADTAATLAVDNPATGEIIGHAPDCGQTETARAIAAAAAAFSAWRRTTALERAEIMQAWRSLILKHQEELARLITLEQGKPLAEARREVANTAGFLRWFAEEARRLYGEIVPSPWPDKRLLVSRVPVGVVGVITPWNFPLSMIGRKVAPAMAAGCAMVVKPAEQTPFSALALAELASQAGVPAGVLNVVTGAPQAIGQELTANPAVRMLSFTGSTRVGKLLLEQSAATVKKVALELGGNAPFLVFDDADLDKAVAEAAACTFRNSGQTCICANRFYAQAGVYDAFAQGLARAAAELTVGNGLEPGVSQGPLINDRAVARVEAQLADALAHGGRVLAGGARHALGGNFFEPTVVAEASGEMACAREETFGPLAPVFRFHSEDEAVGLANATAYGLAAYVYTRDLGRAFRVSEALDYGLVGVNASRISTCEAPFGGVKESGLGREGSRHGLEDYTELKSTCIGL